MTAKDFTGTTIAQRYSLMSKMGDGTQASVYKALDHTLNRTVAIKVLQEERINDPTSVGRFEREGMALSRLNHPSLVTIFDVGVMQEGLPFIVMEYLAGLPLLTVLKKERALSIERCRVIFTQICEALQHAHAQNIIHRDLKPTNVMLTMENDRELAKIVDFGIAKMQMDDDGTPGRRAALTRPGAIFGSPLYMSPEQCQGLKVDARSDQYSFGCMLFECLTGTLPHVGSTSAQTLLKKQQEEVPSLKDAAGGKDFSPLLESLMQRLLARDPDSRFENMNQVREAMRDAFPEQIKAPPPQKMEETLEPPSPTTASSVRTTAPYTPPRYKRSTSEILIEAMSSTKLLYALSAGAAIITIAALVWLVVHFTGPAP